MVKDSYTCLVSWALAQTFAENNRKRLWLVRKKYSYINNSMKNSEKVLISWCGNLAQINQAERSELRFSAVGSQRNAADVLLRKN